MKARRLIAKRVLAVLVTLLIGATAAATPAFADEGQPSDSICYKLSGEDYTQVVCEDPDGTRISLTTYFNDGCITTQDASGESSTCKEEKPELDGSGVYFPNDIACDSEVLSDADGVEYKLVTCRNVDGTLAWQARYTQDGCVTQVDADGGEFTSCPEVQPWLPPTTDISCDSEPWTDDSGVEYKLVTCRDADGNVVSKTRYSQDGCVTQIDADGNEVATCPQNGASFWYPFNDYSAITSVTKAEDDCWMIEQSDGSNLAACPSSDSYEVSPPLRVDERGCVFRSDGDGVVWLVDCPGACYFYPTSSDDQPAQAATCFAGNTPESLTMSAAVALCDVQLLEIDGKKLNLGVCDNGCALVNGMPSQSCSEGFLYYWGLGKRNAVWVAGISLSVISNIAPTNWLRVGDGEWTETDCMAGVMYNKGYCTGVVDRGGIIVYGTFSAVDDVESDDSAAGLSVTALSVTALSAGDGEGKKNTAVASAESAATSVAEAQPGTSTLAPPAARDSAPSSPVSPATAALAYAGVGAAGIATSRLRLRRR